MKAHLNQKYHYTRGITELKKADTLVQHSVAPNLDSTFRSQDHRVPTFKSISYQYSHQGNTQTPAYKMDTKVKSVTSNAKGQSTKRDFSTFVLQSSVTNVKVMDMLLHISMPSQSRQSQGATCNESRDLPLLLPTPIVVVFSCCQLLPLLLTPSPVRVAINTLSITIKEFEEFIYYVEKT